MSTKELALDAIHGLPDDASWREVEERIHFAAAIGAARDQVREGKIVPHEEVRKIVKGGLFQ